MIKVYCDICSKEPKEKDKGKFVFEANVIEIITNLLNGQQEKDTKVIQICKQCYEKHIKKLLYGEKTNK